MANIRSALTRLKGGENWGTGQPFDSRTGKFCLLGAIHGCEDINPDNVYTEVAGWPDVSAVATVIRAQYPDGNWADDDVNAVWNFNDDYDRTWDEVERVLEKAALLLEEDV